MPLDTATLATTLDAIELEAAGGVMAPDALARMSAKNVKIAEALRVFLLTGDVNTTVTGTAAAGIPTVGASPAGATTGATTAPGPVAGTGIGKIT